MSAFSDFSDNTIRLKQNSNMGNLHNSELKGEELNYPALGLRNICLVYKQKLIWSSFIVILML